ncbi:hypothetical protein D0U04_03010 [Bacillus clarus]|uniref:Lipoprotein n=1 Tax=Bacillus clarus TaxID=2338372 RepID=A0A090ZBE2_9BACI|nr:hypothetical protein [Bacillus clarus]KFN01606.1 hypothetical protein DJ93_4049 [Bacillus clarus]RFT68436.1 hypothetical protein D0U04_03010 [Bacillus clarus]
MVKTKWLVGGVLTSLMTGTLFGCTQNLPPEPNDNSCADWDWDDELGVWRCDDNNSSYRGHYYYGGRYYQDKTTFKSSPEFKVYQSSSEYKGGIGSGSKGGFGG